MISQSTSQSSELSQLIRRSVILSLSFPAVELAIGGMLASQLSSSPRALALTVCLIGAAILFTSRSARAGMVAMELQKDGSVSSRMRRAAGLNASVGSLLLLFGAWRATQ